MEIGRPGLHFRFDLDDEPHKGTSVVGKAVEFSFIGLSRLR